MLNADTRPDGDCSYSSCQRRRSQSAGKRWQAPGGKQLGSGPVWSCAPGGNLRKSYSLNTLVGQADGHSAPAAVRAIVTLCSMPSSPQVGSICCLSNPTRTSGDVGTLRHMKQINFVEMVKVMSLVSEVKLVANHRIKRSILKLF